MSTIPHPVLVNERNQMIENVLRNLLSWRERQVLKLRYGLSNGRVYTLEETGRIFRVTRERIRQVERKAMRKLQQFAKPLEPYLGLSEQNILDKRLDERSMWSPYDHQPIQTVFPPGYHVVRSFRRRSIDWREIADCAWLAEAGYTLQQIRQKTGLTDIKIRWRLTVAAAWQKRREG